MATLPKLKGSLTVVNADDKKHARLRYIKHPFSMIDYADLLPERKRGCGNLRRPLTSQALAPEHR